MNSERCLPAVIPNEAKRTEESLFSGGFMIDL
jgi:hypothetical protein